eukprot:gene18294-biopygen17391
MASGSSPVFQRLSREPLRAFLCGSRCDIRHHRLPFIPTTSSKHRNSQRVRLYGGKAAKSVNNNPLAREMEAPQKACLDVAAVSQHRRMPRRGAV